jgi:putative acetyltransferase
MGAAGQRGATGAPPGVQIRAEESGDVAAISRVVEAAFGGPVEVELVALLRASPNYVPELALVADLDGAIVGHTMLTYVDLVGDGSSHRVLTLSPLAVAPEAQGKGIGAALVAAALRLADERGEPLVCLEGSPAHYAKLGFKDARDFGIHFDLPDWAPREAGQIYPLSSYDASIRGRIVYPPAFRAIEALRDELDRGSV